MLESNMNKEDYVSLEVAKLLAENKIEIPTYYHRISKNINSYKVGDLLHISEVHKNHIVKLYAFPAPTLYEVQKWLRKQGDFVVITPRYSNKYQIIEYEYRIIQYTDLIDKNRKGKLSPVVYESYEECFNEGILEALKLI